MYSDPSGRVAFLAVLGAIGKGIATAAKFAWKIASAVGKFALKIGKAIWKGIKWLGGKIWSGIKWLGGKIGNFFKSIGNKIRDRFKPKNPGKPFDPKGPQIQEGVDPNSLIPQKNLKNLDPQRLANVEKFAREMAVEVDRFGKVLDGHHRLFNAIKANRTIDVYIKGFI